MKKGFTLAEVLITLGVIGVVAALTLPTLIENHQKRVVVSRLQKFYTNINQAIKLSEVDNGSCEFWIYPEPTSGVEGAKNFYNTYIKKYLKVLKEEEKVVNSYNPDGSFDYSSNVYVIYFPDGSAMTIIWISGLDITFYVKASDLTKPIVNSTTRTFGFNFDKQNSISAKCSVEPYTYQWDGTRTGLISHPRYGCSKNGVGAFCAKLIQYDGWQISDDYPWR